MIRIRNDEEVGNGKGMGDGEEFGHPLFTPKLTLVILDD